MKMSPELKCFRYLRKNKDQFLQEIELFFGDDQKLSEAYDKIANKFGTSGDKLMNIVQIAYSRSVDRCFR